MQCHPRERGSRDETEGEFMAMEFPDDLKYTKDHEWLRVEDNNTAVVGITDYAQDQLGDIVYVELPEVGTEIDAAAPFGVVESVKAVSDLTSPRERRSVGGQRAADGKPRNFERRYL